MKKDDEFNGFRVGFAECSLYIDLCSVFTTKIQRSYECQTYIWILTVTRNCEFSKECEDHAIGLGPCGFMLVNFACLPTLFRRLLCLLAY